MEQSIRILGKLAGDGGGRDNQPVGRPSDLAHYGARLVIVIGAMLSILCFVVVSFHTRLWELYVAYGALLGTGCCFCGMIAMTTIANNWFVKKRSLALSILLTAGGLGGDWSWSRLSWR